jgi:cytochrome P450
VIIVAACAANRDGEGMAEPDAFDITAPREPHKPLTFGAGIHYCLGVNLARAELQEALTFLAPRMPGLRLDGEAQIGSINGVYGIDALPLAWGAAR